MPKLTIDGMEVTVEPGTSILQAAEQLGIEIPRFCYHDRLSVPANCRMCLVEMEGAPKPVASCAMPCADDMKIHTKSDTALKARKGVMEFLLINHPLDCPICDQGGECDLQDQAVAFGYDRSRYQDKKRAVKDKAFGPLVKTVMTRCIQCTRCIRFGREIAGVNELGLINRGEAVEIGTYVEKAMSSELSGNLIDVCPVGALTSKPYEFTARPWELKRTDSIDVSDAVGSNISIHTRGSEIMRIVPRLNEAVNEEWIHDKARFAYDGLQNQRLDQVYMRDAKGNLKVATWHAALTKIAEKLQDVKGERIGAIAGDMADSEAMSALQDLMEQLGSKNTDCRQDGANFDLSRMDALRFNTAIEALEDADAILLIGTDIRHEAAIINARIRKASINKAKIAVLGEACDLTYNYEHLGETAQDLEKLLKARSGFAKTLKDAERPVIILGNGAVMRKDGEAIHHLACQLADKCDVVKEGWNGFNFLHHEASRMGALSLGFVPVDGGMSTQEMLAASSKGKLDVLYLLGADNLPFDKIGDDTFVIYQGHHGDHGAIHADVVLPGVAYTEKNATYVNVEGRSQLARAVAFPLADAKEDWKIIRALSEYLPTGALPYDNIVQLRATMADKNPVFDIMDEMHVLEWQAGAKADTKSLMKAKLASPVTDFYMTDVICRASATMLSCSEAFVADKTETKVKKAG